MTASRLTVRYAAALALSQLLAAVELTVLVIPMRNELVPDAAGVFGRRTFVAAAVLAVVSVAAVIGYAVAVVDRKLRWFTAGQVPTAAERQFVRRLLRHQSALLATIWTVSGLVLFAVNRDGGPEAAWLIAMSMLFGASTSMGARKNGRITAPDTSARWWAKAIVSGSTLDIQAPSRHLSP